MNRILLLTVGLLSMTAYSQKKLIGKSSYYYDETNTLQGIDSSAFSFATFEGSIYSNGPEFTFDESVFDWNMYTPLFAASQRMDYFGSTPPLTLGYTYNYYTTGARVDAVASTSDSTYYTYDANGNKTSEETAYYNGSGWDPNTRIEYEYNAGNLNTLKRTYYDSGSGLALYSYDSLFYNGSNLVRFVTYTSDNNGGYYAASESIITWNGTEVSNIRLSEGSDIDPLTWIFDIDYTYTAGKPTQILGYEVVNDVPQTPVFVEISYGYTGNLLTSRDLVVDGDLFDGKVFSYDAEGFVTDVEVTQFDFMSSSTYVSEVDHFYYQSTAGVNELSNAPQVVIFPNPTSEMFAVKSSQEIQEIAVINTLGEQLITSNTATVDVRTIPAGTYFVRVTTSEGSTTQTLIKK